MRLRDDLHWCNSNGRAVFLDVRADRYFCLSCELNEAFLRLTADERDARDFEKLQKLVSRGLLFDDGSDRWCQAPAHVESPTCDFFEGHVPSVTATECLQALGSELRALWLLRTKSFQHVIETARNCNRGSARESARLKATLQAITAGAAAIALITRSHDRCLVRALGVHFACLKRGLASKLVFGVIAHPFAAHCWVQYGKRVIVGGFEEARLYTPILVLE